MSLLWDFANGLRGWLFQDDLDFGFERLGLERPRQLLQTFPLQVPDQACQPGTVRNRHLVVCQRIGNRVGDDQLT